MTSAGRGMLLALVMIGASAGADAQTVSTTAGAINGTVTDATRALLPGVTITLSVGGPAAMGSPTAVTDQNGFFRLPSLAPGDYTLTFDLSGFGTVTREGIHVSLGFTATVNVEMSPGSVANINVIDVRSEKALVVNRSRITGFFDVYNIFNTNAEQALTTSSGSAFLRPTAITPPRIARIGVKLQW
jgi:Carboxypeptidase regulatory-like domain